MTDQISERPYELTTKTKEPAKQKNKQNQRMSETNECVAASLFDSNLFLLNSKPFNLLQEDIFDLQ